MTLSRIASVVILAALAVSTAHAAPRTFDGLFSGAAESPPTNSPGTGTAIAVYDADTHMLTVDVTFTGLVSGTQAAHLHCCSSPGVNSGVAIGFTAFPTGVTAGTYQRTFDLTDPAVYGGAFLTASGGTAAGAEAALAAGLPARAAYFNIHTTTFAGGEIRADLAPSDALFADGFE